MSSVPQTEVWQRGPVAGFDPLLMPVVHALIQVREDLDRLAGQVPAEHVWLRPGGAASIGFHVRHTGGALDRLFTYAGVRRCPTRRRRRCAKKDCLAIRPRRWRRS